MFHRLDAATGASDVLSAATGGDALGHTVNYWTDLMPFIVLMSFGMGLTFVPMTLTAVHHVRHQDSGIGSGVLNTMQQVGGALGLAILSTVAAHYTTKARPPSAERSRVSATSWPGPTRGRCSSRRTSRRSPPAPRTRSWSARS